MSLLRSGSPGATRVCPHCKATVLESAAVCPGCRHHLRFGGAGQTLEPGEGYCALSVDGTIAHNQASEPCEYCVVLDVRDERGDAIDAAGGRRGRPAERRTAAPECVGGDAAREGACGREGTGAAQAARRDSILSDHERKAGGEQQSERPTAARQYDQLDRRIRIDAGIGCDPQTALSSQLP